MKNSPLLRLSVHAPSKQTFTSTRATSQIERERLYRLYANRLATNHDLTRQLVSFQANKNIPFYRWLKYKEAFSSELVSYCLNCFGGINGTKPKVLDPFAGAGTTLTTSSKLGFRATGIELLPVGIVAMRSRLMADSVDVNVFKRYLAKLESLPLDRYAQDFRFPHLRITEHAFPEKTEKALSAYTSFVNDIRDEQTRHLFKFACLSVLENVSFTRKDGQYLRWDNRSDRKLKSDFNKGPIDEFRSAILTKLKQILEDIQHRNGGTYARNVKIIEGSCLDELPKFRPASFNLVLTSPPYCNRYDYTRTYALELAFLDHGEEKIKSLRQTLLSATVENKSKQEQLATQYAVCGRKDFYEKAVARFKSQKALHEVLGILQNAGKAGTLNNNNIPVMVENYFFEMNLVISELARLVTPGGHVVMVNDNVRYHGEEVPTDLILSDLAKQAGFAIDAIWVLPSGKGNSSQQMGVHGRTELRKCIYVWSMPH
jgi:DNA modification methylase